MQADGHDREGGFGVGADADPSDEGDAGDGCGRGQHDGVADRFDPLLARLEGVVGGLR